MATSIAFKNVSKRYFLGDSVPSLRDLLSMTVTGRRASDRKKRELWALNDVSFELQTGDALGLIGPNGAGKSTALKILANITKPTSGEIVVNGRIASLIELGAGFHTDLTGRENIALNAAILGIPLARVNKIFDQIVEFSGLEKFIDTPIKRYSSGMNVRLGFAVAAHMDPDILVVDEVLAVGDSQFRQRCSERITELQTNGTTIVFVSHNLFLVKSICSQGLLLGNGKVQARGDIVDVINTYEAWIHEAEIQRQLKKNKKATGELEAFEHSPALITSVVILNENGVPVDEYDYAQPAQVRIEYRTTAEIIQPNFVFHIIRADGVTTCMVRTKDYGYHFDNLIGEGSVTITLAPLQLTGGGYNIEAQITDHIDVQVAKANSRWFMVAGLGLSSRERGGVFVPHVDSVQHEQNGSLA